MIGHSRSATADCDPRAGGRRAGEHDGVDPVVADEGLADRGTWTLNDADEARRRPRLAKQTLDHASDERCQLRRLQDDAVAGGDRRRSLADRETDREVPRSDDRHDPERLVTDRTALVQQDGLAERQASRRERRLTRAGEPFERLDGDEQVMGVRLHRGLPVSSTIAFASARSSATIARATRRSTVARSA